MWVIADSCSIRAHYLDFGELPASGPELAHAERGLVDAETRKRVDVALRGWSEGRLLQAGRSADGGRAQEGNRSAVTGGKHLDAVNQLVVDELVRTGARDLKFVTGRSATVPGFYRATKSWDLIVLQDDQPVLAVEYKSMKGSEGKNLNNRADEVFGVAEDLRQAERHGLVPATMRRAYVFVMGLAEESRRRRGLESVVAGEPDPAFLGASYFDRSVIMCHRMKHTGLYHMAWAVGVREDDAAEGFGWEEPEPFVNWETFSSDLHAMFRNGKVLPLPSGKE